MSKKRKYKYGSVVKLKGDRLQSFGARLTIGYNKNGYPVYHFLRFCEDELDACIILKEYNNNPYDIYIEKEKYNSIIKFTNLPSKIYLKANEIIEVDKSSYTFKQVYEEYCNLYFPTKEEMEIEKETHKKAIGKLSFSTMYIRMGAFKYAKPLHDKIYKNLRTIDFQQLINCMDSPKKAERLRYLFTELDNYAEQKDIIIKGYAKYSKTIKPDFKNKERTSFTNEEIQAIWNDKTYKDNEKLIRDILLILLYTGMRIEELLFLFTADIHLDEDYMVGGLKTEAGKKRIIPIHHLIKPIIEEYYNKDNKFLLMIDNKKIPYLKYREYFNNYMKKLEMSHVTHETRHTVESELDRKNANTVARNLIIGHKTKDTGKDVYSHKTQQELQDCIELLTYEETKMIYLVASN